MPRQLSLFGDWRYPETYGPPPPPTPPVAPAATSSAIDMCGALAYYRAGGSKPPKEQRPRGLVLGSD